MAKPIQTQTGNDGSSRVEARVAVFRINLTLSGELAKISRELIEEQGYRTVSHMVAEAIRTLHERSLDLRLKEAQIQRLRTIDNQ